MQPLEHVKRQIENLGYFDEMNFMRYRNEIKGLSALLKSKEKIRGITPGLVDGNRWLITCTNTRILFLDKGLFTEMEIQEIPLDQIEDISENTGLIFGKICISSLDKETVIKNIDKSAVKPFVNAVRRSLQEIKEENESS